MLRPLRRVFDKEAIIRALFESPSTTLTVTPDGCEHLGSGLLLTEGQVSFQGLGEHANGK
jgi:hypothetical protein